MLGRIRRSDIARSVVTLTTGNAIGQVITIAGIPILTRVYDPSAYGFLAIYVSISTLLAVVATGRYEFAILLPNHRADAIAVKRLARRLLWFVSLVILVVLYLLLDPISNLLNAEDFKYWILSIPLHVLLLGEISILSYWHTRQKNFHIQSRNRILFNGATVCIQLGIGAWALPDVRGLILGLLIAQLAACVFLMSRQGIGKVERQVVTRHDVMRMLNRYKKMPLLNAPTALLDSIRVNGVNLILGSQSLSALGQYSMAWRSVQVPLGLVGSALSQVFFQRMSRETQGDLSRVILRSVLSTLIVSLPIFVLIFLLAPQLLPLVLGADWEDAAWYAQALTPWLYLNLATSPIATVFIVAEAQGRQAIFGVVYTASAVASLFVYRDDLLAAVWAMSLVMSACLVGFIALALFTAKEYDRYQGMQRTSVDDREDL